MRRGRTILAVALVVLGVVAGTGPALAAGTAQAAAPYCGITWGSQPKSGAGMTQTPLLVTRTGQDTCWDRLVFEFNGSATGFDVNYGEAYTEGRGVALSPYTAGGAMLHVRLLQPTYDQNYNVTYPYAPGDHVANVAGYQTLRDVVFGGSFEGQSTFAIGVRATLPFRVLLVAGPGSHSRIAIDIAHKW